MICNVRPEDFMILGIYPMTATKTVVLPFRPLRYTGMFSKKRKTLVDQRNNIRAC